MAQDFWKGKRVIVTGGAGFLGSFVTAKLRERQATDIFIPRIEDYNLVEPDQVRRMYADALKGIDPGKVAGHPPGRERGRHWRKPRASGRVLL